MHPPLAKHKFPQCAEVFEALENCHSDNPFMKFLGVCNREAELVTKCFAQQKVIRRTAQAPAAKQRELMISQLRQGKIEKSQRLAEDRKFHQDLANTTPPSNSNTENSSN